MMRKQGLKTEQSSETEDFITTTLIASGHQYSILSVRFCIIKKLFKRIQFPLQPSVGRSVHKAQGSTLEKVVIDLSQRKVRKVPHLHYVAVRSLENLQILNFSENALTVDDQVGREIKRLQQESMLQLCFTPFVSVDLNTHFKVTFNNCRSLHLHFDDVKADENVLSSHIVALAESRLCSRDPDANYMIPGFTIIRNNCTVINPALRPAHGLVVSLKDCIELHKCICVSEQLIELICLQISIAAQQKQLEVA